MHYWMAIPSTNLKTLCKDSEYLSMAYKEVEAHETMLS